MTVIQLKTWNPLILVEVIQGGISSENFAKRILQITYVDRDRQYDHIELEMDNGDGVLTREETIGAGILIRIKMGYIDGVFPWKAFVVNRMRGGPGVYGYKNPSVGENERRLTLYGRNRNAPGGRPSKRWSRGQASTVSGGGKKKKGKNKTYPPTKDITKYDTVLVGEKGSDPRIIKCKSTSDGVRKIMLRHKFSGPNAIIEATKDSCESICVPIGVPDGVFVQELAKIFGFLCKIDGNIFRWHSETYGGSSYIKLPPLKYGRGPDIISLNMDADFRLPIPIGVKARAYNDVTRESYSGDTTGDVAIKESGISTLFSKVLQDPNMKKTLTRSDIIPVIAGSKLVATAKAQRNFLRRHLNSFQIIVQCTGNPILLAARLVPLTGIGNPIFDRTWYISEARHINNSETYITEIKLRIPPRKTAIGNVNVGIAGDKRGDKAISRTDASYSFIQTKKRTMAARR